MLLSRPGGPRQLPGNNDGKLRSCRRALSKSLKQRCGQCHDTQGRAFNGVVVDDHARLVGNRDRPVAPHDDQSLLLRLVRQGAMPPGDAKLTATEVETLTRWVAQGAPPWPDDTVPLRREFFGEADAVRAIEQDLLSLPQRHRRFIRHFSPGPSLQRRGRRARDRRPSPSPGQASQQPLVAETNRGPARLGSRADAAAHRPS